MAEFFVRRTTAFFIFLVMVLSCAIVGLAVYSFSDKSEIETTFTETVVPEKLTTDDVTVSEEPDRSTQPWELEYRIPVSTIPYHYDLYLHPDLESGKFTGKVTILVGVTSSMTFLVTHFRDMNITLTKLRSAESSDEVDLLDYFGYEPNQFWVMRPRVALKPGNYSMELEFDGSLENKIVGFYKSIYTTKAGIKRSIATSKFQPTDARAAFPCFDEPSFKSTFSLTIVRPTQGYTALSNMPEQVGYML
ncbi:hypothetical protein HAZT_HAZT005894 [Hyalella azteca]|uniref:Aminopeptidase N-like N-terminal domain-containing protein n=1 Tax=Hyalella azteca TaxID=294128 RepID=A0A6A0HDX8_HYAAZ|nr:hypothetical protein HAZT_HAZT005894 [Hyalella azteca]